MQAFRYFLICRWRALTAVAAGILAYPLAVSLGLRPAAAALSAWDVAACWFVATTYWALLGDTEAMVRRRAAREDENRMVIFTLILSAVAASLAGIVMALKEGKAATHDPGGAALILFLSGATLVLSWLTVQALFALHYAHRWFGSEGEDPHASGILFPGAPPKTYRDFLYVAICVGATCQVSDFNITTAHMRNLVTVHALVTFVFNTMVLALGINIIASLLG